MGTPPFNPNPVLPNLLAYHRETVAIELGNRADILAFGANGGPSLVDGWLWRSYLGFARTYEFSEAQVTIQGQWLAGMSAIIWPDNCRAIDSIKFYWPNGTSVRTRWKDMDYLRRYPAGPPDISTVTYPLVSIGPPAITAQHGNLIYVRPYADQTVYTYILDYFQKPILVVGQSSIDPPYTAVGSEDIGATPFMVGDDWLEIIELGAELRGHINLGEPDKAQAIQQLLFGFTVPTTGKQVPGLIAQALNRRQIMASRMDYNIQPTQPKRDYTNVG
jgi:hypothetical protein